MSCQLTQQLWQFFSEKTQEPLFEQGVAGFISAISASVQCSTRAPFWGYFGCEGDLLQKLYYISIMLLLVSDVGAFAKPNFLESKASIRFDSFFLMMLPDHSR